MASVRISQLNLITGSAITASDFFPLVDSSSMTTYHTRVADLNTWFANSGSALSASYVNFTGKTTYYYPYWASNDLTATSNVFHGTSSVMITGSLSANLGTALSINRSNPHATTNTHITLDVSGSALVGREDGGTVAIGYINKNCGILFNCYCDPNLASPALRAGRGITNASQVGSLNFVTGSANQAYFDFGISSATFTGLQSVTSITSLVKIYDTCSTFVYVIRPPSQISGLTRVFDSGTGVNIGDSKYLWKTLYCAWITCSAISASRGITAPNFYGTASNATTASYAISASHAISSSYAETSSYSWTSSLAFLAEGLVGTAAGGDSTPSYSKDLFVLPHKQPYTPTNTSIYVSASALTVKDDANRSLTISSSISQTNNPLTTGVGGLLGGGAITANKWYDLYVIRDPDDQLTSTILVLSGDDPKQTNFITNVYPTTQPAGYSHGTLVASIKDVGGVSWQQWYEYGNVTKLIYRNNIPTSNGIAGGHTITHYLGQPPRYKSVRYKVNTSNTALQNNGLAIGDELDESCLSSRIGDDNEGPAIAVVASSTQLRVFKEPNYGGNTFLAQVPDKTVAQVIYPTATPGYMDMSMFDLYITCEV